MLRSLDAFSIRSSEGDRWLELTDVEPAFDASDPDSPPVEYFVVTLRLEGLRASLRVYGYGAEAVVGAFDAMARDWRGWTGMKEWHSVEGDFGLEATHDRLGHIALTVLLRSEAAPRWQAEGELTLEAGALDRLAADARRFFRVETGTA